MKTLICLDTHESRYLWADSFGPIEFLDNCVTAPDLIAYGVNKNNAILIENVATPPSDWTGNKYLYKNNEWELSPNWVEPTPPVTTPPVTPE